MAKVLALVLHAGPQPRVQKRCTILNPAGTVNRRGGLKVARSGWVEGGQNLRLWSSATSVCCSPQSSSPPERCRSQAPNLAPLKCNTMTSGECRKGTPMHCSWKCRPVACPRGGTCRPPDYSRRATCGATACARKARGQTAAVPRGRGAHRVAVRRRCACSLCRQCPFCDHPHVLQGASRTARTLAANSFVPNGFCMKCTPSSSTP